MESELLENQVEYNLIKSGSKYNNMLKKKNVFQTNNRTLLLSGSE